MRIIIKTITRDHDFDVYPNHTIYELKTIIGNRMGFRQCDMHLFHNTEFENITLANDNATIASYNIMDDFVIYLAVNCRYCVVLQG